MADTSRTRKFSFVYTGYLTNPDTLRSTAVLLFVFSLGSVCTDLVPRLSQVALTRDSSTYSKQLN